MTKLWINCAELSADIQAAELLLALKRIQPNLEVIGMGGENLATAGQRNLIHISELSVMGLTEVIKFLPKIIRILYKIYQELKKQKPDAIILVDAPDLNFQIARMAKYLNIPVFYFIPPKIWAWRQYRARFLAKKVRKVYAILPFELDFYKKYQVNVAYYGNPIVEKLNLPALEKITTVDNRVALMPGSRKKEVLNLLPEYAKMVDLLLAYDHNLEFYLVRASNISKEILHENWQAKAKLNIVEPEDRYKFLKSCKLAVVASGTATLETGLLNLPSIVAYKISKLSYCFAQVVVSVKYVSLTNLILAKELFPEQLQEKSKAENLAQLVIKWLENPQILKDIQHDLDKLRTLCTSNNSAEESARDILRNI